MHSSRKVVLPLRPFLRHIPRPFQCTLRRTPQSPGTPIRPHPRHLFQVIDEIEFLFDSRQLKSYVFQLKSVRLLIARPLCLPIRMGLRVITVRLLTNSKFFLSSFSVYILMGPWPGWENSAVSLVVLLRVAAYFPSVNFVTTMR